MVTAGCMALCIQTDNTACEAQDNYREVGGDDSALFLPSPQIFGQLKARPGSRSCWRLLWQQVPFVLLLLRAATPSCWALWLAELEQLGDTLQPPELPGLCRAPGTGETRVRGWALDTGKGRAGRRAAAPEGPVTKVGWQRSAHLHSASWQSGESYQKQNRGSVMLRQTWESLDRWTAKKVVKVERR